MKKLLFLLLIASSMYAAQDVALLMKDLYGSLSGYGISEQESKMIHDKGGNSTYGEITPEAVTTLLEDLKLTDKDHFYDLGSGIGKVCVQVYLETPAEKVVGVELSPTRHQYAQQVKRTMEARKLLQPNRALEFFEQNILDVPLRDATVIFMCSTCFSEQLMEQLVKKFTMIPHALRVVTLKQLPQNDAFELVKTYQLPMTWSKNSPVYVYQKKLLSIAKQSPALVASNVRKAPTKNKHRRAQPVRSRTTVASTAPALGRVELVRVNANA